MLVILGVISAVLLMVATLLFGGSAVLEIRLWRRAASLLGCEAGRLGLSWDEQDAWRGWWRHHEVALRLVAVEQGVGARLYVRVPTRSLRLRPRGAFESGRMGDPLFDDRWWVQGTTADRALLTAPLRAMLSRISGPLEVRDGWLCWEVEAASSLAGAGLRQCLYGLAELVRLFEEAPDLGLPRIEAMVTAEPVAGVRWRALARLGREAPALGRELAERALKDRNPQVRWVAARLAEDVETLRLLCADEEVPPEVRRRAGWDLTSMAQSPAVAHAQLEVAHAFATQSDPRLQSLAPYLAAARGAAAEPVLVSLLEADHRSTQRAAARALGRLGGPTSLPHLRALSYRTPLLSALYPDVRSSMDQIRTRCAARAGGLTLVGRAMGREVSLVRDATVAGGTGPRVHSRRREPAGRS